MVDAADIVHQLYINKLSGKNKGRKPWVDEDEEPHAEKQYNRPIGPQRETIGEKASRYGRSAIDFRDDLYGYRHSSREERFKQERAGRHLSRNTGGRAASPIGNVAFFPPVLSASLPGLPDKVTGSAKTRSSGRTRRAVQPEESHSAFEPWYVPPSLQDLF